MDLFRLDGKVAVVTGGCGVLCSTIARGLAQHGAKIVLLDKQIERAKGIAQEIGDNSLALYADVLDRGTLEEAAHAVRERFGGVDILVNCAGGNKEEATTNAKQSFFDLPPDATRWVFDLNFLGTLLPSQVFGGMMVEKGEGTILNISSMSAFRPLTRIVAYSAAKAAVSNFTQWLAVYLAQEYSPNLRVNALAPGFFLTQQNRFLMTDEQTGALTPRGKQVLDHTPMKRFGDPADLIGAVLWLVSPASSFVTGAVIPIDGGFSAYSGV